MSPPVEPVVQALAPHASVPGRRRPLSQVVVRLGHVLRLRGPRVRGGRSGRPRQATCDVAGHGVPLWRRQRPHPRRVPHACGALGIALLTAEARGHRGCGRVRARALTDDQGHVLPRGDDAMHDGVITPSGRCRCRGHRGLLLLQEECRPA
jgi:hypothetical protein